MRGAQHTPGPWTLRGKRLDVGTDAYCVASDWGGSNWKNDAPLIAAAPDLLAALRDLTGTLEQLGFGSDCEISGADTVDAINEHFEALRAAIAKATGGAG